MTRVLILFLVFLLVSCAPKAKPERARVPPNSRTPPVSDSDNELTPERAASNALVDDGEKAFRMGLYDRAADLFQEAVSIDATNGEGYYHLALTKIRTGEYGEAEGLVEKTETILGGRSEWDEKLEELRQELEQKKPE